VSSDDRHPAPAVAESPQGSQQDRFLLLLEAHKRILFKVAGSYGKTPADREDLAQEMVLQLWRSFHRYQERFRFSTWMYRIALNVAISFCRRETRRSRHVIAADDSILLEAAGASSAGGNELRLLHEFLQQLDELDRALMILYLDGNPHDVIAEILGISETNVGTKVSRIKQRLRRDLAV
jgi:RNA polymerase sigma-70 factor (ECF subfamily)